MSITPIQKREREIKRKKIPEDENKNNEASYEIKWIKKHRKNEDNTYSYLVSWKGYSEEDDSWVQESDFDGVAKINQYWKNRSTKKTKRSKG